MHDAATGIPVFVFPADAVGTFFIHLRHAVDELLEPLAAGISGPLGQQHAAFDLEGTHQGVEDVGAASDVERLLVARHHPARMEDHPRCVGGDLGDEGAQLVSRYAGELRLPFRRAVLDRGAQGIDALDPAGDEFLVVDAGLQHLVDDGEIERVVGVGADLPMARGLVGGDGDARVDVGATRAVLHPGHEVAHFLDLQRFEQVAAVEHYVARILVVEDDVGAPQPKQGLAGMMGVAATGRIVVAVVG